MADDFPVDDTGEPEFDDAEQTMREDGFTTPRLWMPQQRDRRAS